MNYQSNCLIYKVEVQPVEGTYGVLNGWRNYNDNGVMEIWANSCDPETGASYSGNAVVKQVLTNPNGCQLEWVPVDFDTQKLPYGAVEGGNQAGTEETLHIIRGATGSSNKTGVGNYQRSINAVAFKPINNGCQQDKSVEVLVSFYPSDWAPAGGSN